MNIIQFNNDEKDNTLQDTLVQLSQKHTKAETIIDNIINNNKNHPLASTAIKDILDNIFYNHFSYIIDEYFTDEKEDKQLGKIELTVEQQAALLKILLEEDTIE